MRKLFFLVMLLCLGIKSKAQNDTVRTYNNYDYFKTITFKIGGGVLIPQGKLKNYFEASPLLELSADFPLKKNKSLEIALQFVVPNQKESFQYLGIIDTVATRASFVFNPMLRFKKHICFGESKLFAGLGIGASIIKTNLRNPFYEGKEGDEEKYEMISSILISPDIGYMLTFKNGEELTFGLSLQYTPYKIEGALHDDIGGTALVPKLLYKF